MGLVRGFVVTLIKMKKIIIHLVGLAFGAGSFIFICVKFFHFFKASALSLNVATVCCLFALSVFAYPVHALLLARSWTQGLRLWGNSLNFLAGTRIFFVSSAGKYLPGNIGHQLGRMGMAKQLGVSFRNSTLSLFLEIAMVVGVSVFLTVTLTPFSFHLFQLLGQLLRNHRSVLVGVFCVFCMALCVIYAKRRQLQLKVLWSEIWCSLKQNRAAGFSALVNMFLATLALSVLFALVGVGIVGVPLSQGLLLASVFPLAWMAGLITPGAPAGLGSRELMIVFLLSGNLGESKVVMLSLAFRVVTVLGDLIVLLIGLGMGRLRGSYEPQIS